MIQTGDPLGDGTGGVCDFLAALMCAPFNMKADFLSMRLRCRTLSGARPLKMSSRPRPSTTDLTVSLERLDQLLVKRPASDFFTFPLSALSMANAGPRTNGAPLLWTNVFMFNVMC